LGADQNPNRPDAPARGRARRRKRRFAVPVLLLLVAASLLALRYQHLWFGDAEQQWIRAEQARRATLVGMGLSLSGTPDLDNLAERLKAHGTALGAPIFVRIFKREFELELWLLRDGRFEHFATYPVCQWSGALGPKLHEGDRQAPEGFYLVDEQALNPNSRWHRSFNLGYPNTFDRANGRTGSLIMVHGGCSSIGCFAMTDPVIDEIWRIVTAAFRGGQKRFQVQVFPFRMTEANLELHRGDARLPFWLELKPGYDLFEASRLPPKVTVCDGKYGFAAGETPDDGAEPIEAKCQAPKPAA
jgi:murein L,D-transpeptidase YafK